MVSALADGESTIRGLSSGLDVAATSQIMEQLGATRDDRDDVVTVIGPTTGLHASDGALDCGNSGTTMRLLAGVVSGVPGEHQLVGDASLSQRPMDRVAEPLTLMGSHVEGTCTTTMWLVCPLSSTISIRANFGPARRKTPRYGD